MTKIQETLDALEAIKQAINDSYAQGYAEGKAHRTWIGLTDDEVAKASGMLDARLLATFHAGMYVAQKILKEKNE